MHNLNSPNHQHSKIIFLFFILLVIFVSLYEKDVTSSLSLSIKRACYGLWRGGGIYPFFISFLSKICCLLSTILMTLHKRRNRFCHASTIVSIGYSCAIKEIYLVKTRTIIVHRSKDHWIFIS